MYLKRSLNNKGRTYLSIAHSYRKDGKPKTKTIASLGYLDELEEVYTDPIAHFTAVAQRMSKQREEDAAPVSLKMDPMETIALPDGTPNTSLINLGDAVIAHYYENVLGLTSFWATRQQGKGLAHDANAAFRLLVKYAIMFSTSFKSAFDHKHLFTEKSEFTLAGLYRSLPFFSDQSQAFINHVLSRVQNRGKAETKDGSGPTFCYLFAIDCVGSLTQQLVGKAIWEQPIILVSIIEDANGIPLSYHVTPAKEASTFADIVATTDDGKDMDRMIVVSNLNLESIDALSQNKDAPRAIDEDKAERIHALKRARMSDAVRSASTQSLEEPRPSPGGENVTTEPSPCQVLRLSEIERVFDLAYDDFEDPPARTSFEKNLEAHLLVSFTAHTIMSLMQSSVGHEDTASEIANALRHIEGRHISENYYLFDYRTELTDRLASAAGIDLSRRIMSTSDIRKTIAKAKRGGS